MKSQNTQGYVRCTKVVEFLLAIEEDIKLFHLSVLLLSGLQDNYGTLVTALDAHPNNELTLE